MGWESIAVVGFDLGSLLQGQTMTAKLESACNFLIIGRRGWHGKQTYTKSWARNLLLWSDLTLDPPSRSNEDSQT